MLKLAAPTLWKLLLWKLAAPALWKLAAPTLWKLAAPALWKLLLLAWEGSSSEDAAVLQLWKLCEGDEAWGRGRGRIDVAICLFMVD